MHHEETSGGNTGESHSPNVFIDQQISSSSKRSWSFITKQNSKILSCDVIFLSVSHFSFSVSSTASAPSPNEFRDAINATLCVMCSRLHLWTICMLRRTIQLCCKLWTKATVLRISQFPGHSLSSPGHHWPPCLLIPFRVDTAIFHPARHSPVHEPWLFTHSSPHGCFSHSGSYNIAAGLSGAPVTLVNYISMLFPD